MCLGKNYMMSFFLQMAIAWAKQAELVLEKVFFDEHSHLTQPYQASSD